VSKNFQSFMIFLATGFGVGYSKKAPGTLGSLVGLPFAIALGYSDLTLVMKVVVLLIVTAFGFWVTAVAEKALGIHDDQRIVIDEVVGQMVTISLFTPTFLSVAVGFLLFRLFDIWKPGLIGYVDEKMPGAVGTFFDDILAGIAGAVCMYFIFKFGRS
jgi:phosphatidylglycerophosphatase A